MTCAGAPEEICGGFFAMSVYQFGTSNTPSPTPMTTPAPVGGDLTALGCWTDSQAGRIFGPIALSDPDMTSAVSASACATRLHDNRPELEKRQRWWIQLSAGKYPAPFHARVCFSPVA